MSRDHQDPLMVAQPSELLIQRHDPAGRGRFELSDGQGGNEREQREQQTAERDQRGWITVHDGRPE
jgi:hypothetical protein